MRILYIDIDSLRADHLGCYGYERNTSPNIDSLAARGVRFAHNYTSDAPCLPSRSALFSVRFGIHNGVVGHGGTAGSPFIQGPSRGFRDRFGITSWMSTMRSAGYRTATVSTFGERHSAWHWYAGFNEVINHGTGGMERADEVYPYAERWLRQHAGEDNWFLHVNFWDPHTPYRTPEAYGNPFASDPAPSWLTQEILDAQRNSFGPHSAREVSGYGPSKNPARWPRTLDEIRTPEDYKFWIDNYDTGIRYADDHVGRIRDVLQELGILEDTLIIVSADHGENQGELNVYGDHQTADLPTCRIPLIISGPGVRAGHVDEALHYHLDLPPTLLEWMGREAPAGWDGRSYASALTDGGTSGGHPYIVVSQMAWACQRSVRFDHWLLVRTYDPGLKDFPPVMLFDIAQDPHETKNVAEDYPEVRDRGLALLEEWHARQMSTSPAGVDPLWTVMREGGSFHTRAQLDAYCERLRNTGRAELANRLYAEETARRSALGNT